MGQLGNPDRNVSMTLVVLVALAATPLAVPGTARADSIPSIGTVLWDTRDFNGRGFWGTTFYFQAKEETNPSYDWYIVAAKINRGDGGRDMDYTWTYIYIGDTSGREVVTVDADPIYHTPWTGSGTFSLGTSSASVSITVEGHGYDTGRTSNPAYNLGRFYWEHAWTQADKDTWNSKQGGYTAKTQEVNGISNTIYGSFYISYQYAVWDWWCFCVRYYSGTANAPHGRTVYFTDSTSN